MDNAFSVRGRLVDISQKDIYPAEVSVKKGMIASITKLDTQEAMDFILPGFVDSHVHIESSMLVPSEFARLAVVHGTVATVSDPHEIANVCGIEGVEYMIRNGKTVPFRFYFGAPSCVPATPFETAGASLDAKQVARLLENPEIHYLSEMMNFPGVLNQDEEVMQKIKAAHHLSKPVDGHAPGLKGDLARQYIEALEKGSPAISTDHECFTAEEALDKLKWGMKIIIREGSAAKNFEALIGLLNEYPGQVMFCSDDKHPDSLVEGHINQLCARAVAKGIDIFKVLQAACINPVLHYKMENGLLRAGDPADFILVKDLQDFQVIRTYIQGELVAEDGRSTINVMTPAPLNNFSCSRKSIVDFEVPAACLHQHAWIIEALEGQLITNKLKADLRETEGSIEPDPTRDILKIVVVNRYADTPVAKAFIKNFGLKEGAMASSVAHDSHNIVAVGTDDKNICLAVNAVIEQRGGISFVKDGLAMILPLPIAGLMSNEDGYRVAEHYSRMDAAVKEAGATLSAPFMTLSFMALLVIPHLKLSDKGLFDGDSFQFI